MARRPTLSSYAGPMPRRVVPRRVPEFDEFAERVEVAVQRQDEGRVLGDPQVLGRDRDPLPRQPLDLVDERVRIDDDAIADDRELARAARPRRQKAQLVADAVDDKGMAGVVAALEAHDDVGALRQPVDDLALAFVAPLRSDDDHIRHVPSHSPREIAPAEAGAKSGRTIAGCSATRSDPAPGVNYSSETTCMSAGQLTS